MSENKAKKPIREFVNDEELRYQMLIMKYATLLRFIDDKSITELKELNSKKNKKRLKSLYTLLEKTPKTEDIKLKAINHNIKVIEAYKPYDNKEDILNKFQVSKKNYLSYLKDELKEHKKGRKKHNKILKEIKDVENFVLTKDSPKDRFSVLITRIVYNLAKVPSFKGYSNNWKVDFYSNAISKAFLSPITFDDNLLSKRTGKKIKAFAYITQIAFNAFKEIINIRKKDEKILKKVISLESSLVDGISNTSDNNSSTIATESKNSYTYEMKDNETVLEALDYCIDYALESNEVLEEREMIDIEKDFIKRDKNLNPADYQAMENYLKELESLKPKIIEAKKITNIIIYKTPNSTIPHIEDGYLCGLSLEILEKCVKLIKPIKPRKEAKNVEALDNLEDLEWFLCLD